MQITTGTVVDGKVVVAKGALAEGARVTVIAAGDAPTFELSEEETRLLTQSIVEIESGRSISGDELLRRIRGGA